MKEKTAISYLIEEVNEIMAHIEVSQETNFRLAVVSIKAKEMERQQIEDAWNKAFTEGTCFGSAPTEYKYKKVKDYFTEKYE